MGSTSLITQNYEIELTTKYSIIEKILDQSIYYENILLDTPIERRFKGPLKPLSRFDRANTWEYLKEKTTHIIYFINYIKVIQDRMTEILANNINKQDNKLYYISKNEFEEDFILINQIREKRIRNDILSYLSGYLKQYPDDRVINLIYGWEQTIEKDKIRRRTNIA